MSQSNEGTKSFVGNSNLSVVMDISHLNLSTFKIGVFEDYEESKLFNVSHGDNGSMGVREIPTFFMKMKAL